MAPKGSAEMLSIVPRVLDVPYGENTCVIYASLRYELVLLVMNSMLLNQKYIVNKVSLNKHI